ncbi:MAG: type III-A CRISPR-associated protein Csm2 [Candidatus Acididesulfobacter guangdongensis]|uniref:CRISPR system Cms protein Csm2 n=1 Tax=Acididesulfobacter guangdongensis TaxID=2597225 RepID=A0A519BIS3_ACIG2|nr:MAG: type III-A CRISPR-associated protein Csm2 [Candidatus Acididesulfobacter guangdongensis]
MDNKFGNKSYNNNPKNQSSQNSNSHNRHEQYSKKVLDADSKNFINSIKYYDEIGEAKNINVNLFSEKAEEIVNQIAKRGSTCTGKEGQNKITQLRRFYNDILTIKNKIEYSKNPELEFQKELPYIKMIAAKANYACQRDHITMFLNEFIKHNVLNLVKTNKDYNIFCTLFESIIAYSTGTLPK